MRYRSLFVVSLCLACVALGAMLNRPATGQGPLPPALSTNEVKPIHVKPVLIGRYQVAAGGGNFSYAVVIDTTTGHTWSHNYTGAGGPWTVLGIPTGAK